MTRQEINQALKDGKTMIWNDPDPIEGNDYTVQKIWDISDEEATIFYGANGSDKWSTAEVFISEISLKDNGDHKVIFVKTFDNNDDSVVCNGAIVQLNENVIEQIKFMRDNLEAAIRKSAAIRSRTGGNIPTNPYELTAFYYHPTFLAFNVDNWTENNNALSDEDQEIVDEFLNREVDSYVEIGETDGEKRIIEIMGDHEMNEDCTILKVNDYGFMWTTILKHTNTTVTTERISYDVIGLADIERNV